MAFDPLVEERVAEGVVVPRDPASGAPFIVPRGETEPIMYGRASGLADYLAKDIFGIKRWEMRLLAEAMGRFPDLAALAGVEGYNTGLGHVQPLLSPDENKASGARLDDVIARALDRIGIHEKADIGTVIHAATEPGNSGVVPAELAWMIEAYNELTAGLTVVGTEVFVANDVTRTAGTFDHAYVIEDQALASQLSDAMGYDLTGLLVGDKKTGKSVHPGEFEIQLGGTYANGEVYLGPPVDGVDQRLTLEEFGGMPVNRTTGLLVHVSTTGSPKPRVIPIDLERGWRLGQAAAATRDARAELQGIRMPSNKYTHQMVNRGVLDRELLQLTADSMALPADQTRVRGLALHSRFNKVWTPADTEAMKAMLS